MSQIVVLNKMRSSWIVPAQLNPGMDSGTIALGFTVPIGKFLAVAVTASNGTEFSPTPPNGTLVTDGGDVISDNNLTLATLGGGTFGVNNESALCFGMLLTAPATAINWTMRHLVNGYTARFSIWVWALDASDISTMFLSASAIGPDPIVPTVTTDCTCDPLNLGFAGGYETFYFGALATADDGNFTSVSPTPPWNMEPTVNGQGAVSFIGSGNQTFEAFQSPARTYMIALASVSVTSPPPPTLSVNPTTLSFVNEVWGDQSGHGYFPHVGDGQGGDGTDHAQQIQITSGGSWSVTSDDWLDCQPKSGSGNATVNVNLWNINHSSLPLSKHSQQRVAPGQYQSNITVTSGANSVVIPVNLTVGYGDYLG